jgi:menaquinone-dependent protoporphyrinogen oxidase
MKNTLIIYSSIDGHTKVISTKIAEYLSEKENVDLVSLAEVKALSLKNYQQIIIGASIRYGNYRKDLFEFINNNLEDLNEKENAFFSVNVVARKSEKNSAESNPYVKKFLKATKWKPKNIDVFAGVVDYPAYNFFDKFMIRLIMWITSGPTDPKSRFEFTDWNRVERFAEDLIKFN